MTDDLTTTWTELLAEHEYVLGVRRGAICLCGFVPNVDPSTLQTQQDYHRAHVAAVLAASSALKAHTDEAVEAAAERVETWRMEIVATPYGEGWNAAIDVALAAVRAAATEESQP